MDYLILLEILGVVASAIFGILLAARHGMDVAGVFTVAFAVAFGGGTLRDLFLDRQPLFWIGNPHYPMIVFGLALLSGVIVRHIKKIRSLLLIADSVGMALFAVVGTGYALEASVHPFVAIMLGVVTGTFGGVIGEVICNEVPSLFRPGPLNASCAFAGSALYILLLRLDFQEQFAMLAAVLFIVCFRVASVKKNWSLPAIRES